MPIISLITPGLKAGAQVGKHKIPRFIYHMTNKANYESMLKDGAIKMSEDGLIGQGVFMTELTNLFKRWQKSTSWRNQSLQEKLIQQIAKGSDDIVILKIPTHNLDKNMLRVRSQNKLFSWGFSKNAKTAFDEVGKIMEAMPEAQRKNWVQSTIQQLKQYIFKTETRKTASHLTEGSPASNGSLLKKRKEAIEYVYRENIPITAAEKIGELNIADLRATSEYDPTKPMRSIFTHLLAGTPEVKGAELLNC